MGVRWDASGEHYTRSVTGTSAWSAVFWVYLSATQGSSYGPFGYGSAEAAGNAVFISGGATLKCFDLGSNGAGFGSQSVSVGTWYKMAVTVSGTNCSWYHAAEGAALTVDSVANITSPTGAGQTWFVGHPTFASEWWNGRMAYLRVYDAQLSQAEVEAELASTTPVRTSNLIQAHPFDVAETTDYSGLGNTLSGGTGASTEASPSFGPVTNPDWVADRGSAANVTSQTTTAVDMAAAGSIKTGNFLLARVAANNSGTNGAACTLTISDPRSNTWTVLPNALQDPGAADAGIATYLAYCRVVNAYTDADDITLNWSPTCTAKSVVIEEWTNVDHVLPIAVTSTTANGVSGTPSIARTPTSGNQVFYGVLGVEGTTADSYTEDTDTTSGAWVTLTKTGTSGTAASQTYVTGAYKVVSDNAAQTWNPTITSRDWAQLALVLAPKATAPIIPNRSPLVRANVY